MSKDLILISDHFNYKKLIRFAISPILMMIFTSLYGVVDGFFISNYAGLDQYAGVNLIMPVIMIIGGVGFMFGSGGSALVGKLLGENNNKKAKEVFSMIVIVTAIVGLILSIIGTLFIKPISIALGKLNKDSSIEMINYAIRYGRVLCIGQVFFMIQGMFHSFLLVDGKPKTAFLFVLIPGLSNMVLDFIFIGILKWDVEGAALATILGYIIGSSLSFIYFLTHKEDSIYLVKTKIDLKSLLQSCFNGSSEFVNNISSCLLGVIFNIQLLRYYGDNGISAYGTLMYVGFIFVAVFIGFSISTAPLISFNYGANNQKELSNILKKSLIIVLILSLLMFIFSETIGPLFAKLFLNKDKELLELTKYVFMIVSIEYIFCGFSIFLSSFFTSLNNGLVSALISFLRTLVIQTIFVFLLPSLIGKEGIWWSVVIAEVSACVLSFIFLLIYKNKYHYFQNNKL